ncbi:hypothetical protein BB559_003679 [Furculomyces boomerangus]|uniref:Uncharacterized protein n=1 Tax=Furculomyces boomerangus TaxID=61424 RepID=A0A2T9YJN7_9FUNG|nr:hypothetical protein BB559_003679 [Furculomyces boomerangus]
MLRGKFLPPIIACVVGVSISMYTLQPYIEEQNKKKRELNQDLKKLHEDSEDKRSSEDK